MKAKLFLALAAIFAIATSASADVTIIDAPIANSNPSLTPQGDYFWAPGLGNAGGFLIAGGPYTDSTFNGATEDIGPDLLGGSVLSSDLVTDNGDGTFNLLLTLSGGDLFPAGQVDGAGVALDLGAFFVGANGGGTPIDFGDGVVNTAFLEVLADGATIIGPVDLIPIGFDIQSGSFGANLGGVTGIGVDTINLDINITANKIPEPTSLAILGGLGLGMIVRRRR